MLAGLLCNLGTQAPQPAAFFPRGGGPFRRQHDEDEDENLPLIAKEARKALPGPKAEKAEAAIFRAVQAIRESKPAVVLDAQRIYERVFTSLRGELRQQVKEIIQAAVERDRLQELWRAEVKRRIQQEDDEELICLIWL